MKDGRHWREEEEEDLWWWIKSQQQIRFFLAAVGQAYINLCRKVAHIHNHTTMRRGQCSPLPAVCIYTDGLPWRVANVCTAPTVVDECNWCAVETYGGLWRGIASRATRVDGGREGRLHVRFHFVFPNVMFRQCARPEGLGTIRCANYAVLFPHFGAGEL